MQPERIERLILLLAAAAFLGLWAALRPPMYLASDEAGNLALAYVLEKGTPFADVAGRHLPETVPAAAGHTASRYPPGLAALLVPLTWLGPESAFLLPLAAHLAAFYLLAWLLRRAGIGPLWAMLWLFYPTAELHSRVLMSNLPEAFLLLAAFALLVRGGKSAALAAGLVLGLGLLVRPMIAVGAGPLFVGALWRQRREVLAAPSVAAALLRSEAGLAVLGALPGLLALLAYNWYVFGSPLDCGYRAVGNLSLFFTTKAAWNLPRYALFLSLVYPLMLLAPLAWGGKWKLELVLVPAAYLLFYGSYGWFDAPPGSTFPETVVRSLRFLLPAVPFLLVAYAGVLSRGFSLLPAVERTALALVLVGGLAGAAFVSHRHLRDQRQQAAARDELYARTAENSVLVTDVEVAKLIQEPWGHRTAIDYQSCPAAELSRALARALASGRKAYLVALRKPGASVYWTLDADARVELEGDFRLSGEELAVGDWRLGVWRLEPLK